MNDQSPSPPTPRRSSSRTFTLRFDKFRRRTAQSPPASAPPTPVPTASRGHTSDWFERDAAQNVAPPPLDPTHMTRQAYMRSLQARMEQLERVPTRSFFHSYAGEFDVRFCIFVLFGFYSVGLLF